MATQSIGPNQGPLPPDAGGQSLIDGTQGQAAAQKVDEKAKSSSRPDAARTSEAGEKLQISQEAQKLLRMTELMSTARKNLEQQPELRAEKIREVRERLQKGVYDTRAVRDELAHRLTSILGDLPLPEGDGEEG